MPIKLHPKRVIALPLLLLPLVALVGSGLGCELIVDVDPMLLDGSPDDVSVPMTLDGYNCTICTDVSPDADFTGDESFRGREPKDAAAEGASRDSAAESSPKDSGPHDAAEGDGDFG